MAKSAGIKFSFGTNNADQNIGDLDLLPGHGQGVWTRFPGHVLAEARSAQNFSLEIAVGKEIILGPVP